MRSFLFALLTVALPLPASALCMGTSIIERFTPEQRSALEAEVAATPYAEGLIWKASKGDHEITLVGTMHIHSDAVREISKALLPTLRDVDELLVEMTLEEQTVMQDQFARNPDLIYLNTGPSLIDVAGPEMWDKLKQAAAARNIPPFMMAKMQPWFAMMTLGIPACAMGDVAGGTKGLDTLLMTSAQAMVVKTTSVEDWQTVLDLFAGDPIDEQLAKLELSILPPDIENDMFVAMLDGYADGRVAEVWHLSRAVIPMIPGLDQAAAVAELERMEKELLTDRNHNWMPVILEHAANAPDLMVAVGAAHLTGTDGLLTLLEVEGWSLARID